MSDFGSPDYQARRTAFVAKAVAEGCPADILPTAPCWR